MLSHAVRWADVMRQEKRRGYIQVMWAVIYDTLQQNHKKMYTVVSFTGNDQNAPTCVCHDIQEALADVTQ